MTETHIPAQNRSDDALATDRIHALEDALRRAQEDLAVLRPQLALLPDRVKVDRAQARIQSALQR